MFGCCCALSNKKASLAAGMLLDHLGEHGAAGEVEAAVIRVLPKLPSLGTDSGVSTDRIGDMVIEELTSP